MAFGCSKSEVVPKPTETAAGKPAETVAEIATDKPVNTGSAKSTKTAVAETAAPKPVEIAANKAGAAEQKVRDLVEQLASQNPEPARDQSRRFLERPEGWDPEKQQVVFDARQQLAELGKAAFPFLLESMNDDRYSHSASYSVQLNHSVGDVCRQIFESNIRLIGMRFKSRTGADGESHMCPNYFDRHHGKLDKWWQANQDKSLQQMRIEVLTWRIKKEREIGFSLEEVRESRERAAEAGVEPEGELGTLEEEFDKAILGELLEKLAEVESGKGIVPHQGHPLRMSRPR